jgi:hypothetical protein
LLLVVRKEALLFLKKRSKKTFAPAGVGNSAPQAAVQKSWMPAFAGMTFDLVMPRPAGLKIFCFFF